MAITTYAELQTAIADWLARSGDSTITAIAPDLIKLCESRINYGYGEPGEALYSPALRVRPMETRATATVDSEYTGLPSDFLEMRELKINNSPEKKLTYVTPQQFAESSASYTSGTPVVYTITGSEFRLGPTPSSSLTAELLYYAKVPDLATNSTNWLLTASPNVYLYGSLVEAAPYVGDDERIAQWFGIFSAAIKGLQAQDRRAKYGGAQLIMRPVTSVP